MAEVRLIQWAYSAKHLVAMHTQCKSAILNIELTR